MSVCQRYWEVHKQVRASAWGLHSCWKSLVMPFPSMKSTGEKYWCAACFPDLQHMASHSAHNLHCRLCSWIVSQIGIYDNSNGSHYLCNVSGLIKNNSNNLFKPKLWNNERMFGPVEELMQVIILTELCWITLNHNKSAVFQFLTV